MDGRIRIIKRGAPNVINPISTNPTAKSDRQRERETVETVKTWVADWQQRRRSLHDAAILLICSIDRGRENTTKEFALVR
jgi:hypothetical protein